MTCLIPLLLLVLRLFEWMEPNSLPCPLHSQGQHTGPLHPGLAPPWALRKRARAQAANTPPESVRYSMPSTVLYLGQWQRAYLFKL